MKPWFPLFGAVRAFACAAAISAALLGGATRADAAPLGTVTIATNLDLTTLDGSQNVTTWHRWVYRNLYDPLISLDAEGKVIPWLAERWERINDVTWRFHLRKGVKFHNGEPLEASAVKLWLEQAKQPNAQARGSLVLLKEARVVDAHTVDIVTLQNDKAVIDRLELIRGTVAKAIGFITGPNAAEELLVRMNPLMYIVGPPRAYTALNGKTIAPEACWLRRDHEWRGPRDGPCSRGPRPGLRLRRRARSPRAAGRAGRRGGSRR